MSWYDILDEVSDSSEILMVCSVPSQVLFTQNETDDGVNDERLTNHIAAQPTRSRNTLLGDGPTASEAACISPPREQFKLSIV